MFHKKFRSFTLSVLYFTFRPRFTFKIHFFNSKEWSPLTKVKKANDDHQGAKEMHFICHVNHRLIFELRFQFKVFSQNLFFWNIYINFRTDLHQKSFEASLKYNEFKAKIWLFYCTPWINKKPHKKQHKNCIACRLSYLI